MSQSFNGGRIISEEKLLANYQDRITEYAHEHMEKHGLFKQGYRFDIASFYEETKRTENGEQLLGYCLDTVRAPDDPRIVIMPLCMRLTKREQKTTVLHEIAHALSVGDNVHGQAFLEACQRVMPYTMLIGEILTWRNA
jgi:hypothetical protein